MKIDKLSRGDFFKMLGGGAAASAIATGSASGTPATTTAAMETALHTPVDANPMIMSGWMDVSPHLLWARFRAQDFRIRNEVRPFAQMRYPDPAITNIDSPCSLCIPHSMVIGGIMVLLDGDMSDSDVADFERNVVGTLQLGMKHYEELPMSRISQRARLDQLVNRATGEPTEFVTAKMYRADPPHYCASGMMLDFRMVSAHSYRSSGYCWRIRVAGWRNRAAGSVAPMFRTDSHHNPTAFTTDIAAEAKLKLNVDYAAGDPFEVSGTLNGKPQTYILHTAKLLGDPIALTIRVIDALSFVTSIGTRRWMYISMPKFLWDEPAAPQKRDVIGWMYQREGGEQMRGLFPNYGKL